MQKISNKYVIDSLLFLIYAVFGISWAAGGSLMPQIKHDLNLTMADSSFISTSITLAKIVGALLASVFVTKLGFRKSVIIGSLLISISILSGFADSYLSLLFIRFIMGFGSAICLVCLVPIVQQLFELKQHSLINGVNAVSNIVGTIIALLISPILMETIGSWRLVLSLYGGISLIIAILWIMTDDTIFIRKSAISHAKMEKHNKIVEFKQALFSRTMWGMFFFYIFPICLLNVSFTFYPIYFEKVMHFAPDSLVYYCPTLINIGILIGPFICAIFLKKIENQKIILLWAMFGALIAGLINLFSTINFVTAFFALLSGICVGLIIPIFFTIPSYADNANPLKTGYIMSLFWVLTFILVTFNLWLIGYLEDFTKSFIPGFIFMFVLSIFSIIGIIIMPKMRKCQPLN